MESRPVESADSEASRDDFASKFGWQDFTVPDNPDIPHVPQIDSDDNFSFELIEQDDNAEKAEANLQENQDENQNQ